MTGKEPRKLVRESEWWRVFEIGAQPEVHESKLGSRERTVSFATLERQWPSWSLEERLDFANAFSHVQEEAPEVAQIYEFLMANGDEYVCANIALSVTTLKSELMVLRWLEERLQASTVGRLN